MANLTKRVFVYGGKGALGDACVNKFKALNWVSDEKIMQKKKIKKIKVHSKIIHVYMDCVGNWP